MLGLLARLEGRWMWVVAAVLGVASLGGCGGIVDHVSARLDGSLASNGSPALPIEVDLVGVNASDKDRFTAASVDEYFRVGNQTRATANKVTLRFDPTSREIEKSMMKNDPMWGVWKTKKANEMVVLVSDLGRPASTRVRVLPLQSSYWEKNGIELLIDGNGARSTNGPKAKD